MLLLQEREAEIGNLQQRLKSLMVELQAAEAQTHSAQEQVLLAKQELRLYRDREAEQQHQLAIRCGELYALKRLSLLELDHLAAEMPLALARVHAQAAVRRVDENCLQHTQASECVVCLEVCHESFVFVPCGHQCCCQGCGQKIISGSRRACPLCNAPCQLHIRVHSS